MLNDILVVALLLLLVVGHLIDGAPTLSLSIYFFCSYLVAIIIRERNRKKRADFINQLKSQRKELRKGGTILVDNNLIAYKTILCTYNISIGGLFSSVNIPSPYQINSGETQYRALTYSLLSILTGWWSLKGPLMTVQLLNSNLRGGRQIPVYELIDKK